MNEAEKKLVEALRSGGYQQAKDELRDYRDRYCCLGVACDVLGGGRWRREYGDSGSWVYIDDTGSSSESDLPAGVRDKLGWANRYGVTSIEPREPRGQTPPRAFTLLELNDDGLTFDQIADVIEAGLVKKEGE